MIYYKKVTGEVFIMARVRILPVVLGIIVLMGCMGPGRSPVAPDTSLSPANPTVQTHSATNLWGVYSFTYDSAIGEFLIVPARTAEFTCNVVNFLNGPPPMIGVLINSIDGDVFDLDISLSHPFPGLDQFTGFDVVGVFIGHGSEVADWNPDLSYPGSGDQRLLNADGFTRWFNPTEFNGTMPLFAYTPGALATPGYTGTATLMPYKYFADGLSPDENLWEFLTDPTYKDRGAFRPVTNRRNYVIEFPPSTGVSFNYAVVAHWEPNINSPDPPSSIDDFPISANADETIAVALDMKDSTLYWNPVDGGGGSLIADISVFDWSAQVAPSGEMEEYDLKLSSSLLSSPYTFNSSEMTPVSGGDHYSTYHVELTPGVIEKSDHMLWVIAEYPEIDYSNDYGITNDADGPLQACFAFEFTISSDPGNQPPEIISGVDGPTPVSECDSETYSVVASDPDPGDVLTYIWSVIEDGQPDVFDITGEDEDIDINWQDHGDGMWKVNCRVSDGVNAPVTATPLVVEATYQESCCPYAPNAAYDYSETPYTIIWHWAYLMPVTSGDTFSGSSIDMDFMHDDTDRLVVNDWRTAKQLGCLTPVLNTSGTNVTIFLTNIEVMSIDVGMDNELVYVEWDPSVVIGEPWRDLYWPNRTKAVEGADTIFHVFDTDALAEIGTGFDIGAQIQAIDIDEYGTIWVMDVDNEMHCFEQSGGTYVENTARNFDMDDNGSSMQGLVYDFAINFHNESFYILTNATVYGYLYRVECDGQFNSTIDGNPNPSVDIWNEICTNKADIIIDNFDDSGNILDGEQDAQILCAANIEMSYNIYASKIGITRIDAALGNEVWYLFEGSANTGYGATCSSINGITNTMYTKCGPPFGNQYIIHRFYRPDPPEDWY